MAQSSGYFSTARTKMNFRCFGMSSVKNLLCECGTQTHRHTYACMRAKQRWVNERKRAVTEQCKCQWLNMVWFVFWSPAVFAMCWLALVAVKAHIILYLVCAFLTSNHSNHTHIDSGKMVKCFVRVASSFPSIHFHPYDFVVCRVFVWAEESRQAFARYVWLGRVLSIH